MAGDSRVFKFFRRNVDGKHLMRFQIPLAWSGHLNFHTSQKWLFLEPSLFEMVVQPLKGKEVK